MELRHLRYFIAAAENENVSLAAQRLHLSQPGLSRQIHDLEEEIGIKLFERGPKSLRLTAGGKVFLDESRLVIERLNQAVRKACGAANQTYSEIHVGYASFLSAQILPAALRSFQSRFRSVRVILHDLATTQMIDRLKAAKLDVALFSKPSPKMLRGLACKEVTSYPICAAVSPSHRLANSASLSVSQVVDEGLIAFDKKTSPEFHEALNAQFAALGRLPRIVEEHESINSIIAAVESEAGFTLVPTCVACIAGVRLRLIPLEGVPSLTVVKAWRKNIPLPQPITDFIEMLSTSGLL